MKMLRILIVFNLLMFIFGHGQVFNTYFPAHKMSLPHDVHVNSDSSYTMFSVYQDSLGFKTGLAIFNYNANGTLLLKKEYYGNSATGFNFFNKNKLSLSCSEASFLVLGAYSNSNNNSSLILSKINRLTLDTVWTRYYSDLVFEIALNNIIKLNDNRFLLLGSKFDKDDLTYGQRTVIFETDTLGNIKFRNEVAALKDCSIASASIDQVSKTIYLCGSNFVVPALQKSYVAALDTNASLVWYQQIGNSSNLTGFTQIETSKNNIVLSGFRFNQNVNNFAAYELSLVKLSANNGNIIWQKVIPGFNIQNALLTVHINNDGSIISAGCIQRPFANINSNSNAIVLKTDSNGNAIWMKEFGIYPSGPQEMFYNIKNTSDKGYILCGQVYGIGQPKSWTVKIDSSGNAPGASSLLINTVDIDAVPVFTSSDFYDKSISEVLIYPNPVKKVVYLKNSCHLGKLSSILFINMLGEVVLEKSSPKLGFDEEFLIDISDLKNGIYFIKLLDGSFIKSIKKIVKE